MPPSSLRVLIVEDSAADAGLVERELKRLGRPVAVERVQDAAGMSAALERLPWDLIISDWSLSSFSGMGALATVDRKQLDIPLIIVSGTVGEETAVAAMRAGARDYVLKHKLERLLPVVERELADSEVRAASRRSGAGLQQSRAQMRQTAERGLRAGDEQLRHSEKLEAVGRLAGGIAHDFNNLMSIVLSYSTLLAQEVPKGSSMHADLEEIKHAGERATALTRQLLAFSRRQLVQPVLVDLNAVIVSLEHVLRRLLGEDIDLQVQPALDLAPIVADPHQIEQVIVNLAVNARDAMTGGGRLTLQTASVIIDEEFASEHEGAEPGWYVRLTVSDTGCGIDEQIQASIFEPFFTTKDVGKGVGLGLSTVLRIVRQSQGCILVASQPAAGATFEVYLPVADEHSIARVSLRPSRQPQGADPSLRGSETILVVEDDDAVRCSIRAILERLGYRVLEAGNGDAALLAAEQQLADIHLLLTDVVMPQMSAKQLVDRVVLARPGIKVLYMSGHIERSIADHGVRSTEVEFLQKPITPDSLARKVRRLLEAPRTKPR